MIRNLFSIFDSNTYFLNINWFSSFLNIIYLPIIFWISDSRLIFLYKFFIKLILKEIKIIFKNKFNYLNSIFFISLFFFFFINNLLGLFPYIFTRSAHLVCSLTFSLPLWLRLIILLWFKNWNLIFAHIIPQGTPSLLIPFLVLIESISNIIRPITLSIRLTANIIAGHLLLTLIRQTANSEFILITSILIIQIILLILEFFVAIIQSYVFTILRTLYTKETNYVKIK